jgi:dipeptidyl-peptidase-4
LARIPTVAETPTLTPHIEYTRAGTRDMDAMIIRRPVSNRGSTIR